MPSPFTYVIPPAGISAASIWSPVPFVDPASPPSFLAEAISPTSGELTSVFTGRHPVDAWMVTQLRTIRGSGAAVLEEGHRLPPASDIETNDDETEPRLRSEIKRILRPAVDRGDIEVVSITIANGTTGDSGDLAMGHVLYRNLRLNKAQPEKLLIPAIGEP